MIDSDLTPGPARVAARLAILANYLHHYVHVRVRVLRAVVGLPSLRCRFRHRKRRQERLIPRSSGLEGIAPGRGRTSRHGDFPDMLGS